ncbi:MAG TPA: hypothetical protein VND99_01820 [Candidatus Acidoferrales bacterium]|nr:hypothetical protein [Candidatus Acidoferrales bacterium]
MILQELLRNIVLYKGVVKPLLQTWTDSLRGMYARQKYFASFSKALIDHSEAEIQPFIADWGYYTQPHKSKFSLSNTTGTHTMSYIDLIAKHKSLAGNDFMVVLTDGLVDEGVERTSKTYYQTVATTGKLSVLISSFTACVTTGHLVEDIYAHLVPETHGKREYLGEFSLTHEETQLLYLKEGGEYHGID